MYAFILFILFGTCNILIFLGFEKRFTITENLLNIFPVQHQDLVALQQKMTKLLQQDDCLYRQRYSSYFASI